MKSFFFISPRFFAVASLFFVLGVSGFSGVAFAAMSFCNRTSGALEAALGYRSEKKDETDKWISEGWWRIEPGQCARVVAEPLSQRFYFYYGRALTGFVKDKSPMQWSGKYIFCIDSKAFRVEGDGECTSRNYQPAGFQQIDVGMSVKDYTLDFKDATAR